MGLKIINSQKRRLYKKGIILGYKRSLRNQNMSKIRVSIPGANEINTQEKFLGAKIFYIISNGLRKKPRTAWGKIISLHGRTGIFLAKFKKQVSPVEITSKIYIVSKPSFPL